MELEIIENKFISEQTESFLTPEKFEEFKDSLSELSTIKFEQNELGRKNARALARKVGTLKTKITEKFDILIKAEKEKNDEALKYIKLLTSTKAKYLEECKETQNVIKKDVDDFEQRITAYFADMEQYVQQYETLEELKKAKEALINAYDKSWEEKRKDAEKLFTELHDKLVMQEATISKLEKERAERQKLEDEKQVMLIKEQAERLNKGLEIEIPTQTPTATAPATPAAPTPVKEKYTLFFDTETTSANPQQARIVQIGALVFDDNGKEIDCLNVLVQQEAPIPPETIAIHGKTDAMCAEQGIPLEQALMRFKDIYDNCDVMVAHNMPYDETVVINEFLRIGQDFPFAKPKFDTMQIYKNIVQSPPTQKMLDAGFTHFKNPKLDEAYQFIFGKGFDNAHDALSDVKATAELYHHFIKINRAVVATIESAGISKDQARLIAKKLNIQNLTNYKENKFTDNH